MEYQQKGEKKYLFVGLEPRIFCIQGRRTPIIPEEISSLRFTAVRKHYGYYNRLFDCLK
jgi:hypothetical protein